MLIFCRWPISGTFYACKPIKSIVFSFNVRFRQQLTQLCFFLLLDNCFIFLHNKKNILSFNTQTIFPALLLFCAIWKEQIFIFCYYSNINFNLIISSSNNFCCLLFISSPFSFCQWSTRIGLFIFWINCVKSSFIFT